MVPLGEVAILVPGKSLNSSSFAPGDVPVVGGGRKAIGTHSVSNTEPNATIVSATGNAGEISRYRVATFRTADALELRATSPRVAPEFIHVLAEIYSPTFRTLRGGLAQPHLDRAKVLAVEVPIPPIELQRAIAAALDAANAEAAVFDAAADALDRARVKELHTVLYTHQWLAPTTGDWTPAPGVEVRPLGTVAKFTAGKSLSSKNSGAGTIPVIGGGTGIKARHNISNCPAGCTIVSRKGSAGSVSRTEADTFVSDNAYIVEWSAFVDPSFGYHLLKSKEIELTELRRGIIPGINHRLLGGVLVAIPPIELQRAIAAVLDINYAEAASLRKRAADTRAAARNAVGVVLASGPFTAPTNYDFADGAADLVDDDANVDDVDDVDDGTDTGADAAAANAADVDC